MSIAVIGAGIAGLTAAYNLGPHVTLFEKSRGLGGRAATRWYDRPSGRVYVDHGAQYLKTDGPTLHRLMLHELDTAALSDIKQPVWTFSQNDAIREGDPEQNARPKWSYRQGVASLGRLLAARGSLNVHTGVRIEHIEQRASGHLRLINVDGQSVGDYEQVIIAVPAAQAADILSASRLSEGAALEPMLRRAGYRKCISVVLGYERQLAPRSFYALVNTDRGHPISWVGMEHAKPGHVPEGESVLVVQMAHPYSDRHWDYDKQAVIADVAGRVSRLLGEDLTGPAWADYQRWRYALPDTLVSADDLNGRISGLWFAGDYLRGGRVHLAAETGLEVAQAIRASASFRHQATAQASMD